MGNCQAAEAATVVIQHPGGKVERVYWSLSASHVMTANPGHYVAVIITAPPSWTSSSSSNGGGAAVKHLKLLRPDDTLLIGHVYRLVSFEEVLREFSSKRHVRLSSLLVKHKEKSDSRRRGGDPAADTDSSPMTSGAVETETEEVSVVSDDLESVVQEMNSRSRLKAASRHYWKPALQSIAEGAGS